jgi:hypothetical protein
MRLRAGTHSAAARSDVASFDGVSLSPNSGWNLKALRAEGSGPSSAKCFNAGLIRSIPTFHGVFVAWRFVTRRSSAHVGSGSHADISAMSASRLLRLGGFNRSTQHLEQLAINNDDGLPNRSPKCFQRISPQPAIPITGFALPPSHHHEISDLSANNRSLPSKGKCCVDRLRPPPESRQRPRV